jgi:transcriptional regulator with XRE-family HTH domain
VRCAGEIKKLRLAAGLSQNRLARLADLDRGTVSSAENGGEVSELTVSKLSTALSNALGQAVEIHMVEALNERP